MSDIGDALADADGAFEPLEDDLLVRNFIDAGTSDGTVDEGDTDEWGDPTGGTSQAGTRDEHPESPQSARGSIELRGRPSIESAFSGISVEADALGYVSDDVYLTDGGGEWRGFDTPYPSEIIGPDGTRWATVHVRETGTGRVRCLCRTEDDS